MCIVKLEKREKESKSLKKRKKENKKMIFMFILRMLLKFSKGTISNFQNLKPYFIIKQSFYIYSSPISYFYELRI